jgi:hypothetical protein
MKWFRQGFFTFNVWFSYSIALVASAFFGIFLVIDGPASFVPPTALYPAAFFVALFLAVVGSVWMLFNKKVGAWILVSGGLSLLVWHLVQKPMQLNMAVVYGFPYIIPGIFLLLPDRKDV